MLNDDLKVWKRYSGTFSFSHDLPIDKVTIEIVSDDAVIRNDLNQDVPIYITDLHFQAGDTLTGWVPETREFTKKLLHTNDETKTKTTKDIFNGATPVKRTNVEFNEYNIAGRGNEVFTIPNWYPDDWTKAVLPTGLDITLTAKNDYDLMRVCTNYGSPIDTPYGGIEDHPLSTSYTREFTIGAGLAGDKIEILARSGKALKNGSRIPIGGVNTLTLSNGEKLPIKRRSLLIAQKGACRIRIEFYKFSTLYVSSDHKVTRLTKPILIDTGIGYYGTVKFNQWTYGRSRA